MKEPTIYLKDVPLSTAWERFQHALKKHGLAGPLGVETLPIQQSLHRVTAKPIWAKVTVPHYHSAAMDGYAVDANLTVGASDRSPIDLVIGEQAVYVDTGDLMPAWADSVIPIEIPEPLGKTELGRAFERIRLRAPIPPWSHVRPMGEDLVASEMVLAAGRVLRPIDLGAIAGSGSTEVQVYQRPRVAILPTGSELVPLDKDPVPGQIREFNSLILSGQVENWGGLATRLDILPDDLDQIQNRVQEAAAEFDLILVNAGSSAGLEDFTARVVENLGDLLVHGIAVRPGHPVILGMIDPVKAGGGRAIPIIGVPGYPVSAALTGELFVRPLLLQWQGLPSPKPETLACQLTRKVHSSLGDDEFLRVAVGKVAGTWVAAPLSRGAGVLSSLTRADGIVKIPAGIQGLQQGDWVGVELYRSRDELENTLLFLGSHDLTIDLMSQFLGELGFRLSSGNVGSLGGLLALRRGEAHLAGTHLWDPAQQTFNQSYIQQYLPDTPVRILSLVFREQGLILPRMNEKDIRGLEDLTRPGVRFSNRQKGSGTRILLDSYLVELGIDPADIVGYDREEITHMTVAASVASGRADCGLGIRAAAAALDLTFSFLFNERYDLVIPEAFLEDSKIQALLKVLQDQRFRQAVAALPGYDPSPMGEIVG